MKFEKGFIPWNKGRKYKLKNGNNSTLRKGKTLEEIYGLEKAKVIVKNMSGHIPHNKNPHSKEVRICKNCGKEFLFYKSHIKRKNRGSFCSLSCRSRYFPIWNKGKIGIYIGEKAFAWKGGLSFEPYSPSFNQQLKDRIRVRDNFICQKCGVPELECNRRLDVHHIDYNKKNCEENNLISLCARCNTKVNGNRNYWENFFKEKMEVINANSEM